MDPSGVLLALEEQKKWRERRKRIRDRIRQLDRRRSLLKKELDGVRNKILQYGRVLIDLQLGAAPRFHRSDRGGRMTLAGPQATQREIERWRQRERRLIEALQSVDDERRRLDDELLKVEQQVSYYDSLTREMKRELGRPGLSSLLSSLRRA